MDHHNKSRQEVLDVQFSTRYRLCKIQAFIGLIFLLVFSWVSYLNQSFALAVILLGCAIICAVIVYVLYKTTRIELAVNLLNINLFILPLTLLVTGGHENTGILWIYPTLAVTLFVNRFWPAVTLYGSFIFLSSLLLFTPMSELLLTSYTIHESIRFEVTLFLLSLICLAVLHSKERADQMILQLHDEDIRKLAYYDALTGLPNRRNFKKNLSRLLRRAENEGGSVGLLYIDLDNFKQVNDKYGHEVGDKLLCDFSEKLKEAIRPTDMIINEKFDELARLGGDEFVVILNELHSPINSGAVAERILNMFVDGFETFDRTHSVFASIGIATFPDDASSPDELLHSADLAMYEAKRNGRNRYEFYTKDIAQLMREQRRIEEALKTSLAHNLLSLVYMPVFDCRSLAVTGIEVLLRCPDLMVDNIGPEQFIPIAEKSGLIKDIDLWVIENSFKSLLLLQSSQEFSGKMCINISGLELQNELFPSKVKTLLEKYHIAPSSIEFEITETAFVLNDIKGISTLEKISALGISLALDDFGTGFTAFGQLNSYPVNCLKIDRTFVADLFSEHVAKKKMVKIINNLADLYELRSVAEGVESLEQLEYLQGIGCDWVQGFHLCRPLAFNDLVNFLVQEKKEENLTVTDPLLT